MPTLTKYTYAISTDFPGGAVNSTKLTNEIQASSIVTALDRIDTAGDVIDIWFKDALSAADKTTLDNDTTGPSGGLIAAHDNTVNTPVGQVRVTNKTTADDRIRVAMEKSDSTGKDFYTHNWADKTTWFTDSVRVVDEVATDSGDQITYTLANTYIIDTYHGKITEEDNLLDSGGNSYRVVVKVDDVTKTEQDPHLGTGGDYTIDYKNGEIIFASAQAGGAVVKVTYHYAQSSVYKIVPGAGKKIVIEVAEVQFSDDIILTDSVLFQTFGFVEVFAPHLTPSPYPAGTKIPIKTFKYKTFKDYQNAAFKSYVTYPAMGGMGWRGMQHPVIVFDWDYQRGLTLQSSLGMESHLYLEHDAEFGGSWATATLYCGEDTE